jgi:4'-phosphopantetheinyl transferase
MTCGDCAWQPGPQLLILPPGEVQVWQADLSVGPEELQRFADTLSPDERARAERFCFPKDQRRYTAARGLLRAILARYLMAPAADLRFCQNVHGKPALIRDTQSADLRFNVSHSHQLALFSFALGREVGVDVEHIRTSVADERIAERFFSLPEVSALKAVPEYTRAEAFFQCWTRKEAYIKARGAGFSINLASFAVSLASGQPENLPITSSDDPEASRWSLRPLAAGDGYAAAVAAEGRDWSFSLWRWV